MSDDASNNSLRKSLDWVRESGLLAVTVIGLILYFFLSIPATLFYSQLGTTPGEVGLNYVNLLSGSTFELLVISILLAIAVLVGGFLVVYFLIAIYSVTLYLYHFRTIGRNLPREDRLTLSYERDLAIYRRLPEYFQTRRMFWPNYPETVDEVKSKMARRLDLLKAPNLTSEESAAVSGIESRLSIPRKNIIWKGLARSVVALFLMIRHRIRKLVVSFALAIVIIVLPVLAFIQARQVYDGHAYFASDSGIFDYSADPVIVYPVTPAAATQATLNLKDKKLFLLGENTVDAVLYSPADHATIRVPIDSVVISTVRG
jgi:hypothetical protein